VTRLPLAQIRRSFVIEARPLDTETEAALRADPRPGAKAILNAIARRRAENRSEGQRLRKLLQFENASWAAGVLHVAGVDEAGMSPLAGPVAAAAVIFAAGSRIPGIDDSKKLDAEARKKLAVEIKERAVAWSVAFAQVEEIDRINIYGPVFWPCVALSKDSPLPLSTSCSMRAASETCRCPSSPS
jgi:ribonuclease HII